MKKLKGITDVFFDLDHTLWDFDKNSTLTFNHIFKLNNLNIDLDHFLSHYVPINFNYWKLYREEKIEKEALRYGRLNDVFLAMNIPIEDKLINKLSNDYITYLTTYNHLFEDAIEVLEYLKDNYKLHTITNGFSEVQEKKLKKSNIHHYFNTITNSEMVGVKKPNPLIFKHALKSANTNVNQSVMIGDNYEADILGALNIGMDAILYDMHNSGKDLKIKNINKLIYVNKFL